MSFREFLESGKIVYTSKIQEAKQQNPWPKEVIKKSASQRDRLKGESYTVVNTKTKEVLWTNLKRESANEVEKYLNDPDIISGSSSFIYDKYISKWNK